MGPVDELATSNDIVDDFEALRERMRRDGYLLVRGLVDPALANDAGREARAALCAAGWAPTAAHAPDWNDPGYRGFALSEAVNRLPYEPGPQHLMHLLMGAGAFVYPLKVPRAVYPDRLNADHKGRFVHQDYGVIGKQDLFTMWFPLEDIPLELGPLGIRPGSSREGWAAPRRLGRDAPGWLSTRFEPGDALVFHCLTWHAALPNTTDRMRLSVDVRWQLADDPAPSRLVYGPGGRHATGGGELLWRLFGHTAWWRPIPPGVRVVESTSPPVGTPIAASRYVDFPAGQRQPASRMSH